MLSVVFKMEVPFKRCLRVWKQICFKVFLLCVLWIFLAMLNMMNFHTEQDMRPAHIKPPHKTTAKPTNAINSFYRLHQSVSFEHAHTEHVDVQYFPESYVKYDPTKVVCNAMLHTDPGLRLVGFGHTLTELCVSSLCQLNENRDPPIVYTPQEMSCIRDIKRCLTVIVKTRNRLVYVRTFISSLRKFHPDLRIIVVDELVSNENVTGANDIFQDFPSVTYVKTNPGMGHGRNTGLKLVTTKYFLTCDDDFIILKETNLTKMVQVLESTDISIVGGTTADHFPYDGIFRVYQNSSSRLPDLIIYPHAFYDALQCFARCYIADIMKNFFMGKTFDILSAGGWDSSREFYEHEDFFLRMRSSGLKIALCRDVIFRHWMRSRALVDRRYQHYQTWQDHLLQKWQMGDMYFCNRNSYVSSKNCPHKINFMHS